MKNLLKTESGNLPKELVLKALYSLSNPKDIANMRASNSFFKALIDNDPKLHFFVQIVKQSLKIVYTEIENTNFKATEKEALKQLLEHEIFQKLSTLFKNKTPQEKKEVLKSLKDKFSSDINSSFIDTLNYSNIEAKKDRLFLRCAELRLLSPLEQLLKRKDINPAADNNHAILFASENGHPAIVERLLQDKDNGVNPATWNNWPIRYASKNGHLAVVNLLLQDERVDPAADNNSAIGYASRNGYTEVVKALLNHQLKKQPELSIEQLIAQYTNLHYWGDITKDTTFIDAIKALKLERLVQQGSLVLTQYTNTLSPVSKEEPQTPSSPMPKNNKPSQGGL